MEIKIEEDKNMNHHQIKLVIHPQTRHIAEKMIDTLNDSLKNIKVYDDENNKLLQFGLRLLQSCKKQDPK